MNQQIGIQSIEFEKPVYIIETASIVGKKEGEGPFAHLFDKIFDDDTLGEDTWEKSESKLQKETVQTVINKSGLNNSDIRYMFAGDLLEQSIASSFGLKDFNIPLFGLYGACSTMGESLIMGSMTVAAGYCEHALCLASSHFASAEKQFRFPLDYAGQRPLSATWTVTGCGAAILGTSKTEFVITAVTPGKIVDYGIKDSQNMGAAMAPAAASTIAAHLKDFERIPDDYDKIITGDLGRIGSQALIDLLKKQDYDISNKHMDCGLEIFYVDEQDVHSGASGCGCAAATFCAYILREMKKQKWSRILFVPTGALMSKTSFNEGETIPAIAHGVVVERH